MPSRETAAQMAGVTGAELGSGAREGEECWEGHTGDVGGEVPTDGERGAVRGIRGRLAGRGQDQPTEDILDEEPLDIRDRGRCEATAQ